LLESLISIIVLGVVASLCPFQIAFLVPFATRLLGGGGSFGKILEFSLSFSIPLIGVGIAVAQIGSLFKVEHVKLASGFLLLLLSLVMFRILKFRWGLKLGSLSSRSFMLGFSYGILTIGRGAPLLLSVLIILSNLRSIPISMVAMFLYSQLMVLPILFLIFTVGWKVKNKLEGYGRILDMGVGIMLTVLAIYYITSAMSLAWHIGLFEVMSGTGYILLDSTSIFSISRFINSTIRGTTASTFRLGLSKNVDTSSTSIAYIIIFSGTLLPRIILPIFMASINPML